MVCSSGLFELYLWWMKWILIYRMSRSFRRVLDYCICLEESAWGDLDVTWGDLDVIWMWFSSLSSFDFMYAWGICFALCLVDWLLCLENLRCFVSCWLTALSGVLEESALLWLLSMRDRTPFFAFGGICTNNFDVIAICLCWEVAVIFSRWYLGLVALLGHFGFVRSCNLRVCALWWILSSPWWNLQRSCNFFFCRIAFSQGGIITAMEQLASGVHEWSCQRILGSVTSRCLGH